MKIKLLAAVFAWAAFAAAGVEVAAQQGGVTRGASAGVVSPERERDIRRLLELTGAIEKELKSIEPLFERYKQQMPHVPASVWDELKKDFVKEFNAEAIIATYIPIYSRHFSAKDIKQLILFYRSPVGKKWAAEAESVEAELFFEGMQRGFKVTEKVLERLKAKGYNVPHA